MDDSGPIKPAIELRRNGKVVAIYPLDADRLSIGRSPSNDIRLEDMRVSRSHAAIDRRPDGTFVLIDLDSHCGTQLDSRRVPSREPVPLSDMSRIRLIDYELVFHQPAGGPRMRPGLAGREGRADRSMILKSFAARIPRRPAASADDLSATYRRLLEASRILGDGSSLVEQLARELDDLLVRFPGAEGGIILAADEDGSLSPLARSSRDRGEARVRGVALGGSVARQALAESEAMLVIDVPMEEKVSIDDWDRHLSAPVRAWLCVPLLGLEDRPVGLIQLFSLEFRANLGALQFARQGRQDNAAVEPPPSTPLKPDDLDRLAGLTQSLGLAMEFHRIEQQAGEAACRQIQASLDAAGSRELPGYDFAGLFVPGREFGGSFRDFVPRVTDRDGGETPPGGTIVMGEVAGKGIRSALVMADVRLEIRRLLRAGLELPDVLSRVNRLLIHAGVEGNRVCVALVDIDSRTHRLTVVNAGHDPLVVRRSAGPVELVEILGGEQEADGPPLGSTPDPFYGIISTSLSPGDYVFLTSNASTRYLDLSGPHSVRLRERAAIHPPSKDVALFCFGRRRA